MATTSLPLRSAQQRTRNELPRPNRTQLLFEFDMQRDLLDKEQQSLDYFLPDAYSPSTIPRSDLHPITIRDLELNKRSGGTIIYLKTIECAIRAAAIQTIVEDEEGTTERLAIYNTSLVITAEELLPEDIIIAIKEPTLAVSPSGGYTIRVDHPSDLVILPTLDSGIPTKLSISSEKSKTALEWKQDGNTAYGSRKFVSAISAYSRGLELCTSGESELRYDLYRNRAAANIFLGQYEKGQSDAEAAIIPITGVIDDKTKVLNAKSYERAGHAAYSRGHYQKSAELYEQALKLTPASKEAIEAQKKIEERHQEQATGLYDFEKMSMSCNKKRNRLDHASFLSNTEIREAGKHGRGLFTTKALKAGDLIICEKALAVAFDSDPVSQSFAILDSKNKRKAVGSKPPLLFSICSRLTHDSGTAKEYFKLYDGKKSNTNIQEVDGAVAVDTFRALSILDHNAIGCPTVRSSSKEAQVQLSSKGYPSTGLWLRMSYINHACNANAMRSFIGDMMIVRATRDIAKDEEVFMPYRLPNIDNTVTQGEIQQIWGFKCDCDLCMAEASTTTNQRKQRVQLNETFKELMSKQNGNYDASKMESIYQKMKQTYSEKRFESRPKVALQGIGWIICKAHQKSKSWKKLASAGLSLLQDLGFTILVEDNKVIVDRTHCLSQSIGVDAALFSSHGYKNQNQYVVGAQFEDLAKSLWMIMYGSERGFDNHQRELCE